MSDLEHVLVLAGGLGYEREVSLGSGQRVVDALRTVGVDARLADTSAELLRQLATEPPDAVFLALHGGPAEDGALRGLLDLLGLAYVGADGRASRLAYDKPTASSMVRAAGLAIPRGLVLDQSILRELGAQAVLSRVLATLGLPLVVKPAQGGSSMGLTVVTDGAALPDALASAYSYGDAVLVEQRVAGTEIAVAVVDAEAGPTALPVVEIVPRHGTYDYAAHYTAGATELHVPARLPDRVLEQAAAAAVTAHKTLGLRDLSRADLVVTPDEEIVFLEVSVSPGLTETSTFAAAASVAGLDLGVLYRDLLYQAAQRSTSGRHSSATA